MTLGFQQAGIRVVGAVELDERHVAAHKKNFPNVPCFSGDVSTLSARSIRRKIKHKGRVDIVFGGPPCEGFSFGGKMDPADMRNQLILHFARLVVAFAPKFFVLENVRGLSDPRYKPLLRKFTSVLRDAGYEVSTPKLLNAADYGIPQRRARLFIVGARNGLSDFEYPLPVADDERPTVWDAIGDIAPIFKKCAAKGVETFSGKLKAANPYLLDLAGVSNVTGFGSTHHSPLIVRRFRRLKPGAQDAASRFVRLRKSGTSTTLRAGTGPERGSFMAPRPIHPTQARCICVREAARLQSFPDWFVFDEIKWHAFRQIGNAVPPKLARAVAAQVRSALEL